MPSDSLLKKWDSEKVASYTDSHTFNIGQKPATDGAITTSASTIVHGAVSPKMQPRAPDMLVTPPPPTNEHQLRMNSFGMRSCQGCIYADGGYACGQLVSPYYKKPVTAENWCRYWMPGLPHAVLRRNVVNEQTGTRPPGRW